MSFFSVSKKNGQRYGVIIDIGSGSVLAALVHSNPKADYPTVIWSHRETAPIRNIENLDEVSKAVVSALVNVSMLIESEGRKALYSYDKSARLTEVQCGISAPWSYTVTKAIDYKQEQSFIITEDLIEELLSAIRQKTEKELRENETAKELGLAVVTRALTDVLVSGYHVSNPEGNEAKDIKIYQTSAVVQSFFNEAIEEIKNKLFSAAELKKISFILIFYFVAKDLFVKRNNFCLVDVTYEATEIGIVRDGVLLYATHTPFGVISLAREISAVTKVPLHEAFGYLRLDKPFSFKEKLTDKQKQEVDEVFDAYIDRLAALFHETGDELSIPKTVLVHTDLNSEVLFVDLFKKAAKRATRSDSNVIPVTSQIVKQMKIEQTEKENVSGNANHDSALLLSAYFFHNNTQAGKIDYL